MPRTTRSTIRRYSELLYYASMEERYEYLRLGGLVGERTFGSERYLNQRFYTSREWRDVRHYVIARDLGNDLGLSDFPIARNPVIHHMNPMTMEDIRDGNPDILNPEFLITVSHDTHNAIHYGSAKQLPTLHTPRQPGDTKLW